MPGSAKKVVAKKSAEPVSATEDTHVVQFRHDRDTKNKCVYVEDSGGENILGGQKLYLSKEVIGDEVPEFCTVTVVFE